jgi:hypothetical protein
MTRLAPFPPGQMEIPTPEEYKDVWDGRDCLIYQKGFRDGMHRANNSVQPTIGDLELRISKVTDLLREAIKAANTPSF